MRYWVYMLSCNDGRYYVGSHRGEDLATRIAQHNAGTHPTAWTYKRRPVELVWSQEFQLALQAVAVERQLKGWRRAKKDAVVRGDWLALKELAVAYSERDNPD